MLAIISTVSPTKIPVVSLSVICGLEAATVCTAIVKSSFGVAPPSKSPVIKSWSEGRYPVPALLTVIESYDALPPAYMTLTSQLNPVPAPPVGVILVNVAFALPAAIPVKL